MGRKDILAGIVETTIELECPYCSKFHMYTFQGTDERSVRARCDQTKEIRLRQISTRVPLIVNQVDLDS